jgi:hypothetical protein
VLFDLAGEQTMDDKNYDEAIRKEADWLDQQLVKFVVDELANRQLGGTVSLSDNVLRAIDSAFAQAAVKHGNRPASNSADHVDHNSNLGFAELPDAAPSGLGLAEAPVTRLDKIHSDNQPGSLAAKLRGISMMQFSFGVLLLALAGFGIWQTVQSNAYKAQGALSERYGKTIAEAQTSLDDALCDAGFPAVINGVKTKSEAGPELSDSDRVILAFEEYRQAVPDQTKRPSRADATPPCAPKADSR